MQMASIDQTLLHGNQGEEWKHQKEDDQIAYAEDGACLVAADAEQARQLHQVMQGKCQGYGLGPLRQVGDREKRAAEQKHRCNKQKYRQVEHFDTRDNAGDKEFVL